MMLNKEIKIVIAILGIAGFWMASGLLKKSEKPQVTVFKDKIKPQTQESQAILKERFLKVNATVKAKHSSRIATEVTGLVQEKLMQEGRRVKEGDLLFIIKNDTIVAKIASSQSNLTAAQLKYDAIVKLFKEGLASNLQLEDATTSLNLAKAELSTSQSTLDNTRIKAPFSGTINKIFVNKGDLVVTTDPSRNVLATIVNLEEDEIVAYISSRERALLKSNNQDVLIINDKGISVRAKINFLSNSADETTGTYILKAFTKNTSDWVDGESVIMKILLGKVMAHKIPLSAIIIDKDGNLAIKRLEGDKIVTDKIDIVEEEEANLWITGIPEKSNIILVGHYYAEDR